MDKEKKILQSWEANAGSWIGLLNGEGIASRKLATNQAIVDTILSASPGTVLDIGCGEGWLCRELEKAGIQTTGTDFEARLIQQAVSAGPGNYLIASYDAIALKSIQFPHLFDGIVINFALIGETSTEKLLAALPDLLHKDGHCWIQTLHPHTRLHSGDYISGWKTGSWDGLAGNFVLPYEWYFRTMEDWLLLLKTSGFETVEIKTVSHPESGQPLSVIFTCNL